MKWTQIRRIGWQTAGLLALGAGAALAATSGTPVATPVTNFVHFMTTDVAYGAGALGFAACAVHAVSGRQDTHGLLHKGVDTMIGAGALGLAPTFLGAMGLSAGALIKLIA